MFSKKLHHISAVPHNGRGALEIDEMRKPKEVHGGMKKLLRKRFEASKVNNLRLKTRKRIYPILISIIRLRNRINGYHHTVIGDAGEKTDMSKIFAITHICKADIEVVSDALKEHYYLPSGDFEDIHGTIDELFLELNGVTLMKMTGQTGMA